MEIGTHSERGEAADFNCDLPPFDAVDKKWTELNEDAPSGN